MAPQECIPNPLAGRIFEGEAAAVLNQIYRTKSEKKRGELLNELAALTAAADFYDLLDDVDRVLAAGRMPEQRREAEVELLLEAATDVGLSFPDGYEHKPMSTRFFQFLADAGRCMLAATREFAPVSFRQLLNDGWRSLGRAEEVAWAIEQVHGSSSKGGGNREKSTSRELKAALLEGTVTGTIEELAERFDLSPRNVSFIKAAVRRCQAN